MKQYHIVISREPVKNYTGPVAWYVIDLSEPAVVEKLDDIDDEDIRELAWKVRAMMIDWLDRPLGDSVA